LVCLELGIALDFLKKKTIEDFKDIHLPEEIQIFKFQHYEKVYEKTMQNILEHMIRNQAYGKTSPKYTADYFEEKQREIDDQKFL